MLIYNKIENEVNNMKLLSVIELLTEGTMSIIGKERKISEMGKSTLKNRSTNRNSDLFFE